MQRDCAGPDQVLILAFKQSIRRIAFWIRVCAWWLMLSLLIVTIPPALAGMYHAVRAGLRDPFELTVNPGKEFLRGVGLHLKRSYVLAFANLALLVVIIIAILFWFTREDQVLRWVTAVAISFLLFWWLCQPFLFPQLVEHPQLSVWQVYRRTTRLVVASPLYALVIALSNSVVAVFGIVLFGPSLLYVPTLIALISIQAMWGMTCAEIPDLVDPVVYAERR